jgi:hypothetical protein
MLWTVMAKGYRMASQLARNYLADGAAQVASELQLAIPFFSGHADPFGKDGAEDPILFDGVRDDALARGLFICDGRGRHSRRTTLLNSLRSESARDSAHWTRREPAFPKVEKQRRLSALAWVSALPSLGQRSVSNEFAADLAACPDESILRWLVTPVGRVDVRMFAIRIFAGNCRIRTPCGLAYAAPPVPWSAAAIKVMIASRMCGWRCGHAKQSSSSPVECPPQS